MAGLDSLPLHHSRAVVYPSPLRTSSNSSGPDCPAYPVLDLSASTVFLITVPGTWKLGSDINICGRMRGYWLLAEGPGSRRVAVDDPDNLTDYGFGSGAYALLFRFNHDYAISSLWRGIQDARE